MSAVPLRARPLCRGVRGRVAGYCHVVSVVLVVLVLLLSFVLLTGLAVALAAGAARLTGRGPNRGRRAAAARADGARPDGARARRAAAAQALDRR